MLSHFPTVNKVLITARTFVSVSMMKRFVIVETFTGVSEIIIVFHEVKIDVTLEAANIHPEKHNILVFLSNTVFPPFYVPFPNIKKWEVLGRNLGGTFSFYLRYFFAFQSIPKRSSIEDKAKFYRRPIEDLSNIYRRPIEDLSNIYRRPIEDLSNIYRRDYGSDFLSSPHMVCQLCRKKVCQYLF